MQSSYLNYEYVSCHVSYKCRTECLFDDDDFDEKKGIKLHLQTLDLQSELMILSF